MKSPKYQNISGGGGGAKAMLGRQFLTPDASMGSKERSQITDLSFYVKKLEEQIKLKTSRRKEIIKTMNRNQWIRKQKINRKEWNQNLFLTSIKSINLGRLIRGKERKKTVIIHRNITICVENPTESTKNLLE